MKLARRERQETQPLARASADRSPFRELNQLHEHIDRLFGEPFWGTLASATHFQQGGYPVVDVFEGKESVIVQAELPGMKKEDIEVSMSEGMLNLAGERKEEAEHKDANSFRAERYFGRFQRSIALPTPVQGDKIHAEYKDGVLKVTCPKAEEAKRKQIEVKVE